MNNEPARPPIARNHASNLRIRDPFIVPVAAEGTYYMFGTTALRPESIGAGPHFDCYVGTDLANWDGPIRVFDPPAGYWGTQDYWAAEAHRYNGKYYLFASFKAPGKNRGTDILISTTDSPAGPYVPHTEECPITPHEWECLDGTLFVDDAGKPWMAFCHEWVQISDGTICAVPLSADLRRRVGEPIQLFAASESGWSDMHNGKDRITDGPFLHRTRSGKLLMMWSSIHQGKYAMGVASSESGKIQGPWRHAHPVMVSDDGGHGMLFHDFSGRLMLSLHRPNRSPLERPVLLEVEEAGEELRIVK